MEFINELSNNWGLIAFIFGACFNVGFTYASWKNHEREDNEDKREIWEAIKAVKDDLKSVQTDFTDIKGDIKSINAKLDLLINDKIKR
jgi:predicted metal-dependent enzyme (double-stranded beta helix superfamily)